MIFEMCYVCELMLILTLFNSHIIELIKNFNLHVKKKKNWWLVQSPKGSGPFPTSREAKEGIGTTSR